MPDKPDDPPRRRRGQHRELDAAGPILPYEREPTIPRPVLVYADLNGITAPVQIAVLNHLWWMADVGASAAEIRSRFPDIAGRVSGALSVLHGKGLIVMLAEVRDRGHVYVWPDFITGRSAH